MSEPQFDVSHVVSFGTGIFFGFLFGLMLDRILWLVATCLYWLCAPRRRIHRDKDTIIVSGNIRGSVVQQNGRLWIDGQEAGTGAQLSAQCTRSLRITADGEVLDRRLQPGTPIHIRVEPGVVFESLEVGDDLHVTGNIDGAGSIHVGDSCTIHGPATVKTLSVKDSLKVTGNVSCATIDAGDDITVHGNVYCDRLDAGDDVKVSGHRTRRTSSLRQ